MASWDHSPPPLDSRRADNRRRSYAFPFGLDYHRLSFSTDFEDQSPDVSRGELPRALRSRELIGNSKPLYDWDLAIESERAIDCINNSAVRKYYSGLNEIVEGYKEIDALLDSGLHFDLLDEYGDDLYVEHPRTRGSAPNTLSQGTRQSAEAPASTSPLSPSPPDVLPSPETPIRPSRHVSPDTVRLWININLFANFALLAGKVVVWYLTDSLSIGASLVDSVLDLLSTLIIFFSVYLADRRDWRTKHLYPVGRSRLEPIGVLVFSVVMIVSFIQIGKQAAETLWDGAHASEPPPAVVIGMPSLLIMVITIAIKVVLWLMCRRVNSSSIQALAQDAETDVTFNFFSIVFPMVGHLFNIWQLDVVGALVLSMYVVWSWGDTAMEHIDNLTGAAASPQERKQLLYLCMRFSERIKYITALNVYHAGDRLMCEVDVLMDPSLSMRDCHDLAEALQYALETLPTVERAFVHLEYRRDNFSGHVH